MSTLLHNLVLGAVTAENGSLSWFYLAEVQFYVSIHVNISTTYCINVII